MQSSVTDPSGAMRDWAANPKATKSNNAPIICVHATTWHTPRSNGMGHFDAMSNDDGTS